jgi:hypothetical protein
MGRSPIQGILTDFINGLFCQNLILDCIRSLGLVHKAEGEEKCRQSFILFCPSAFDTSLSLRQIRLTSCKVNSWLPLLFLLVKACRDVMPDTHELCWEAGRRNVPVVFLVFGEIDRGKAAQSCCARRVICDHRSLVQAWGSGRRFVRDSVCSS